MPNSIIADNWSLQEIAELLTKGFDEEDVRYITIDSKNDMHEYRTIKNAVLNTEALFDLLTDIVLRDQIIVEEKYESAWRDYESPLKIAEQAGVIRSFSFLDNSLSLKEPTEYFVNQLCITSTLKRKHTENALEWEKNKTNPDPYLAQVLWGGAGMLARGYVYEKGHTAHPVRKRFFIDSGLAVTENAGVNLTNKINEKRASVASAQRNNDELHALTVSIPPLPIRIIQESNTPEDLIKVALQIREEYQELRNWLRSYQLALTDGTYKDSIKFQKMLHSISMHIDSKLGSIDPNAPTFTVGIGVLKIAIKGQPIEFLKNQFGIRSMINKLILGKSGNSELKKMLGFFDHKNTAVGMKVEEHFSKKID